MTGTDGIQAEFYGNGSTKRTESESLQKHHHTYDKSPHPSLLLLPLRLLSALHPSASRSKLSPLALAASIAAPARARRIALTSDGLVTSRSCKRRSSRSKRRGVMGDVDGCRGGLKRTWRVAPGRVAAAEGERGKGRSGWPCTGLWRWGRGRPGRWPPAVVWRGGVRVGARPASVRVEGW